jgi:hypothetical protein
MNNAAKPSLEFSLENTFCDCDECTAKKLESNHWKVIITSTPDRPSLFRYEDAMNSFLNGEISREDMWVVCSDACFQIAIGRWNSKEAPIRVVNHVFRLSHNFVA